MVFQFKPYLEVFKLSKLLVPGVQLQIQLYLNSLEIWSQKHGGARHIRDISTNDLKMTLFLNQKKVLPSVYRGLLNQFQKGSKKAMYATSGVKSGPSIIPMTVSILKPIMSFTISYPILSMDCRTDGPDSFQWK